MNLFFNDEEIDKNILNQIVRPPRQRYSQQDLGQKVRNIKGVQITRKDYDIQNQKHEILKTSIWYPSSYNPQTPLIVFSHGNSGSRLDSIQMIQHIVPQGYALCSFDFSGCGNSQGELVTLGLKEQEDLQSILNYLRMNLNFRKFILWGRSMGAVVSLIQASKNSEGIMFLVCDSAFSSFKKLVENFASDKVGNTVANLFFSGVCDSLCEKLKRKTGYNFSQLEPYKNAQNCQVPAIFAYSFQDKLINSNHAQQLMKHYKGNKQSVIFQGEHNQIHDKNFYDNIFKHISSVVSKPIQYNRQQQTQPNTPLRPKTYQENQNVYQNSSIQQYASTYNNYRQNRPNGIKILENISNAGGVSRQNCYQSVQHAQDPKLGQSQINFFVKAPQSVTQMSYQFSQRDFFKNQKHSVSRVSDQQKFFTQPIVQRNGRTSSISQQQNMVQTRM